MREATLEELEAGAANHGLKVEQAWHAPSGQGFKAAAARLMVDAEDVLVVAFRSTIGNDEWLEYPQKYWKRTFLPRDGEAAGTDLKVFTVWAETLNEVRASVCTSIIRVLLRLYKDRKSLVLPLGSSLWSLADGLCVGVVVCFMFSMSRCWVSCVYHV